MEQGPDELSDREEKRDDQLDQMTDRPLTEQDRASEGKDQQGASDSERRGG
jgi:hypothetical protein